MSADTDTDAETDTDIDRDTDTDKLLVSVNRTVISPIAQSKKSAIVNFHWSPFLFNCGAKPMSDPARARKATEAWGRLDLCPNAISNIWSMRK